MNYITIQLNSSTDKIDMSHLCRQVSIESPGPIIRDCVFNFEVPVPTVPAKGARILVVCAGACYRLRRSPSISSLSSTSSTEECYTSPAHHGVRDGALFPGYEVAGIIESLGSDAVPTEELAIGKRVIIFPYEGVPHGYAEYIVVPDLSFLVPIPDNLQMSVAAMLPTGALLAKNTVIKAHDYFQEIIKERSIDQKCKILIVGTGGLALWAIRIAQHHFKTPENKDRVQITVASIKDEGFMLAKELKT